MPLGTVSGDLERARERGLVEESATGRWAPTKLGRLFLNDLQAYFLPLSASADSPRARNPRGGSPGGSLAAPEAALRGLSGAPVIHTPDADA